MTFVLLGSMHGAIIPCGRDGQNHFEVLIAAKEKQMANWALGPAILLSGMAEMKSICFQSVHRGHENDRLGLELGCAVVD